MDNLGCKIRVWWSPSIQEHFGISTVFRNVTEIHYNYRRRYSHPLKGDRVMIAFESDIHETGCTYEIGWIDEFETQLETEIAEAF